MTEPKKLSAENFEFKQTLGTGSFGRVKIANFKQAPETDPIAKHVAVKMLKKSEVIRLQQVEHMLAEKSILQSITTGSQISGESSKSIESHPFIVKLFGTFQDPCYLYMVLEFINGGEFFTHLRKAGRLNNDAAKFYGASVTSIFEHLHNADVIYRDLKPENLLLSFTGYLKITDFGFAKVVQFKTYTLCGTPEYIAPEVLLNKGHGKGVDWWTLGILIFEMISGQPPFVDDDPMGIYQQILSNKINFPRFFDRHVKALVKKLLTADLTKRFGCLKNGAEDVKKHKWFKNFSWKGLQEQTLTAPLIPSVAGACDTENFDKYPESTSDPEAISASDNSHFAAFDWVNPCLDKYMC